MQLKFVDSTMFLEGSATDMAEFVRLTQLMPKPTISDAPKPTVDALKPVAAAPKAAEPRRKLTLKFASEAKLLSAISPTVPRTVEEISKISGLGMVQAKNLLYRMDARSAVQSDKGEPERWIRLVDPVLEESTATVAKLDSVVPPAADAAKPKTAPVAKGTNTKFILDLCTDWTRRTVILSRATAAGLNANSVGVQLPILVDRGQLEGRTADDGRVEYRVKPVDQTAA